MAFSLDLRLGDMVTLATSGPDLQPVQGTEKKRHIEALVQGSETL